MTRAVYGAHGSNFVKSIIRKAREHDRISVVADQVGAPTSSHFIAEATAQLAMQLSGTDSTALSGIYHLQDFGHCNWYEFAQSILNKLRRIEGHATRCREIVPIPASAYPTAAQRPANSRLDCAKIERTFGVRMPLWSVDFERRFEEIHSNCLHTKKIA